jgi:hypothetical protein
MAHNPTADPDGMLHKIYRTRRYHECESLPKRPGGDDGSGLGPVPEPEDLNDFTVYGARDGRWTPLGEYYTHNQDTPAMRWPVQHNRGKRFPTVRVIDHLGNVVLPLVDWSAATPNYLEIVFGVPSFGTAFIA